MITSTALIQFIETYCWERGKAKGEKSEHDGKALLVFKPKRT